MRHARQPPGDLGQRNDSRTRYGASLAVLTGLVVVLVPPIHEVALTAVVGGVLALGAVAGL